MEQISNISIQEFIYDSEEEKNQHREEMESKGYDDSGQVKKDINQSFSNPKYVWYGKFYKNELN